MRHNYTLLIIGVILLVLGFIQFSNYENNSITVTATVSDIEDGSFDDELGYRRIYYGDYTVDGKVYTHVKLATLYEDSSFTYKHHIGDTMEIVVSKDDPGKKMSEGGLFSTVGLVLVVWNWVAISKAKKAAKKQKPSCEL